MSPVMRDHTWEELAQFVGVTQVPYPRKLRGSYSYIDTDAQIGDKTIISPFCYIGPHVVIGERCFVGPGTVIGAPGFGYAAQPNGSQEYIPHNAGVIIGDDVHIGANTCIDQGKHRPTRIGRGTRVDNLVHIAHNVEIGQDCLVIALSMLAGTVTIGDRSQISPCASVRDHIKVGEEALVGMGAVVVKDVEDGDTVMGVPAYSKNFKPSSHPLPLDLIGSTGGHQKVEPTS